MRRIKYIAVHCTDTLASAQVSAIQKYWKEKRGWSKPGYHYIIKANGDVVQLLDEDEISNGVKGFNFETVNICYIGGRTKDKENIDTRTKAQEAAMFDLIVELTEKYPGATVQGHRDFPNVAKTCPNFDVKEWLSNYIPDFGVGFEEEE
jgi:N-acetylmuramoyl-L-alanine amidase